MPLLTAIDERGPVTIGERGTQWWQPCAIHSTLVCSCGVAYCLSVR
jgi:hypothetical protein